MESSFKDLLSFIGCSETTVAIILAFVVIFCIYYYNKNKGLPPGPVSFPFLGYSLILKDDTCHQTIEKLQKKYGEIFCFNFAGTLFVNMGSMKVVKEFNLTNGECFERSKAFSVVSCFFADGVGSGSVQGEHWKVLRQFMWQQLRAYGMTALKDNMSVPLYDSTEETISYLQSKKGEPVEIVLYLTNRCNSILRRTMFGDGAITEQQMKDINEAFTQVSSFRTRTNGFYIGFLARFLLPLKPGYWAARKQYKIMRSIVKNIVNKHKAKFNKDEHPKNFIDAYLKERSDRRSRGDPTAEYFTDKDLIGTLIQLVSDGVLGVATVITLFVKHAVDNQDCQDKIYAEIADVVGRDRAPTIEDKSKLQYTAAYLQEVLRTSDIFSVFVGQQCIRETFVRGYRIPKGAMTLLNLWMCHNDPEIYSEPEKFNPTRFMSQDKSKRPDLPITFGVGRRNCIGEGYSMSLIFLFLTAIIQNFKLTYPKGSGTGGHNIFKIGKMDICATPRN